MEKKQQKVRPSLYSKIYAYFPLTNTICKQWVTFLELKIFPKVVEGHAISSGIVIGPFIYNEQNSYLNVWIG
jgi:hypothetical protein